jgi:hypothetical protein
MIDQQEIRNALAEKFGEENAQKLLLMDVKSAGDMATFWVTIACGEGGCLQQPIAQYAFRDTKGRVKIKPIPDWLAGYI